MGYWGEILPWQGGHRVSRAAGAAPGVLTVFQARLDIGAWSHLAQWGCPCHGRGVEPVDLYSPFQPRPFCDFDSISFWDLFADTAGAPPELGTGIGTGGL